MVGTLDFRGTKPRDMWKYIAQRQPVVIQGMDDSWRKFTDDWLVEKAGDTTVMVERRSSAKGAYGQGNKAPMQLKQLVKEVQQGNTGLYMSTQEVGVGRDGHPLLYGPPLVQLAGEFAQSAPLMGQLVPQSINMWMGCAPEGSSTGLHHDFHDNLYVLLRGCKRFRLYPPDAAPDMYVRGKLRRIYANGRIVYDGQGDVQPDGSDRRDVKLWQTHQDADKAAAAAAAVAAADPSHAQQADDALEAQLELMLQEGVGGFEDGFGDLADDYMDSDEDVPADQYSDDDDSDNEQQRGDQQGQQHRQAGASDGPLGLGGKRRGLEGRPQHQQPEEKKQRQVAVGAAAAGAGGGGGSPGPASVEPAPPSFSQVDLSLPEGVLQRQFPRFPGVAAAEEVLLQAGQMLYLPAGWFHEVTSFGGGGLDGGHLAINYWYHPPDNLDSSKAGFKQPYTSPYYPTIWAQRQPWLQQETQRWWQHKKQYLQQQQQQHLLQQQQHEAGMGCPDASPAAQLPQNLHVKTGVVEKKHVGWREEVHSPTNKYHMSMTKDGTATGDARRAPLGSQPGNGPCCGTIGCMEPDTGSESDSPCSSREPAAAAAHDKATASKPHQKGKQRQGQQKASRLQQHATQHADECTLRHVAAGAGTNAPAKHSGQEEGKHDAGHQFAAAAAAPAVEAAAAGDDAEDIDAISEEVQAGIAAIEDYFSGNPDAAEALLAEFLAQRRRRMVAAARREGPVTLALPRLYGRRHHHFVVMKITRRKPALH